MKPKHSLRVSPFSVAVMLALAACGKSSAPANTIGPAGGTVIAAGGKVKLIFPPGALAVATAITVQATAAPPGSIAGSSYVIGPAGTALLAPVQLSVQYDPAQLPAGADATLLRLAQARSDGTRQLVAAPTVDGAAHTASGSLFGFDGGEAGLAGASRSSSGTRRPLDTGTRRPLTTGSGGVSVVLCPAGCPTPPFNLAAHAQLNHRVQLAWQDGSGAGTASALLVERACRGSDPACKLVTGSAAQPPLAEDGAFQLIAQLTDAGATMYLDASPTDNAIDCYRVKSFAVTSASPPSNVVCLQIGARGAAADMAGVTAADLAGAAGDLAGAANDLAGQGGGCAFTLDFASALNILIDDPLCGRTLASSNRAVSVSFGDWTLAPPATGSRTCQIYGGTTPEVDIVAGQIAIDLSRLPCVPRSAMVNLGSGGRVIDTIERMAFFKGTTLLTHGYDLTMPLAGDPTADTFVIQQAQQGQSGASHIVSVTFQ